MTIFVDVIHTITGAVTVQLSEHAQPTVCCPFVVVTRRRLLASDDLENIAMTIAIRINQANTIAIVVLLRIHARSIFVRRRSVVIARRGVHATPNFNVITNRVVVRVTQANAIAVPVRVRVTLRQANAVAVPLGLGVHTRGAQCVCRIRVVVARLRVIAPNDLQSIAHTIAILVIQTHTAAVMQRLGVHA
jgi:hypothetical protein